MAPPKLPGLTIEEVRKLPAMINVETAGRALNMGRSKSYDLAQRGEFPVKVRRFGREYRVATSDLLILLGIAT